MIDTPFHPVARRQEIFVIVRRIYELYLTKEQRRHHCDRLSDLSPTEAELQTACERYSACPTSQ